jgi:hypothetical protein
MFPDLYFAISINILGWSTMFFCLTGAVISGGLLSYPVLLVLSYLGSWISVSAGFACLFASFLITLTLPETGVPGVRSGDPRIASEIPIPSSYNPRLTRFLTSMAGLTHRAFTENKKLGMLIVACLFTTTGSNVQLLFNQSSSQRPSSADIAVSSTCFAQCPMNHLPSLTT